MRKIFEYIVWSIFAAVLAALAVMNRQLVGVFDVSNNRKAAIDSLNGTQVEYVVKTQGDKYIIVTVVSSAVKDIYVSEKNGYRYEKIPQSRTGDMKSYKIICGIRGSGLGDKPEVMTPIEGTITVDKDGVPSVNGVRASIVH